MRTYCEAQGSLLNALPWPEWEGSEGRGDIRIHEADALYYAAETDTAVQSYYAPIKKAPHQERRVASFGDKILDSPVQKHPSR